METGLLSEGYCLTEEDNVLEMNSSFADRSVLLGPWSDVDYRVFNDQRKFSQCLPQDVVCSKSNICDEQTWVPITQSRIMSWLRITWFFFAWVISWFDLKSEEAFRVMSQFDLILKEAARAMSRSESRPGESAWAVSWFWVNSWKSVWVMSWIDSSVRDTTWIMSWFEWISRVGTCVESPKKSTLQPGMNSINESWVDCNQYSR